MARDIGVYGDEWSAEIYDHENRSTADLPFWQALAEETGGSALELGCGSR